MIDTYDRSSAVFAGCPVLNFGSPSHINPYVWGSSSGVFVINQEEDEDELYENEAYEKEDDDEFAEEEEGTEGGKEGKESKEVADY